MLAIFCKYFFGFVVFIFWTFLPASPVLAAEAVLSWSANTAPDLAGYVLYYKDDSNSLPLTKTQFTQKIVIPSNQTSHTKPDLSEGVHRFALTAFDASSNESSLSIVVQKTISSASNPSDTTPPNIFNVSVANLRSDSAEITWDTDEFTSAEVEYGTTSSYGLSSGLNASLQVNHSRTLSNLTPATTYYFRVISLDAAGNLTRSGGNVFTTSLPPTTSDLTAPEITAVFVEQTSERSTTISWRTNEPATSQIEYRRASDSANETRSSGLNTALKYTHILTLTELDPSTQYEYQVFSRDASGNSANSETGSFQTAQQSGGLSDTTPPGDLKLFTANGGDRQIVLSWNNPSDSDFEGLQILYRTDRFPENINDGELLADLKGQPDEQMLLTHSGLENGRTYYYLAATYDQAGNFQTTVFAEAVPESNAEGATAGGGGCGMIFPTSGGKPPGPGDAAEMLLLIAAGFILLIKKTLLNKDLRPSNRAFFT